MVENTTAQVYKWNIETEIGNFTGTSLCIEAVNKEVDIIANYTVIIKKTLTPIISIK